MTTYGNMKDYTSLSDMVYHILRDGIMEGKYQTGDWLTEQRIAEEVGVSRTPVREALKQLELEDLISSSPNRGVVVKGFSKHDFDDVFTIRLLLEGQAAYWAAQRITADYLKRLQDILELMEFYTNKGDSEHLVQLDTDFHEVIYDACQSRTLRNILTTLHQNSRKVRQSSLTSPTRARESCLEHQEIFNALSKKNAEEAKRCIEKHITGASEHNKGDS